eukprot:760381-Hanusia_phi.AAC.2
MCGRLQPRRAWRRRGWRGSSQPQLSALLRRVEEHATGSACPRHSASNWSRPLPQHSASLARHGDGSEKFGCYRSRSLSPACLTTSLLTGKHGRMIYQLMPLQQLPRSLHLLCLVIPDDKYSHSKFCPSQRRA